ncbi:MAG: helix-turn-helix transcriptional regulator [Alphaproteobacteria bacterium]|jgi:transcriptional regulator with XRE-family HTH domain|nr:helix-turn-helix transcriptional regulator [Alphaproteobacteria bacterium]|tara:strand:+ start:950 stop:1759 length:810 start_codon:yes stop_codon:yes gene_type:complete
MAGAAAVARTAFGGALKQARGLHGMSQLTLALEAGVSARHVSFIESGRSQPSRPMVLRLAEALELPLRESNMLLNAAGYAAHYRERGLEDADLAPARRILEMMLERHDPYPALVFNRHWDLVMANMGAANLTRLLDLPLLDGPANLLRLMLHPDLLKPYIEDWQAVARDLVLRARREAEPGDETAQRLLDEVLAYPGIPEDWRNPVLGPAIEPFLTVTFNAAGRRLSWVTTLTTFGTPQDITLQELRIESFYPADEATQKAAEEMAEEF